LLTSKGNGEVDALHLTLLQPTQDNAHEQNNTWGGKGEKNFALVFSFLVFSSSPKTKREK
jgi:hypothetical protein